MKQILIYIFIFAIIPCQAFASGNKLQGDESDIRKVISGQIGLNFRVDDADNKHFVDEGDIGFAFVDIDFFSKDLMNFRLGAEVIAVGKLWADGSYNRAFDDDGIFQKNIFLKSSYLNYSINNIDTEILVGRAEFEMSESMDGDSYQGVQLTSRILPLTSLYLSIINRWVEDASTGYDIDGIQKKWLNGGDIGDGVSNTIYSIIADIDILEDIMSLSPYYNYQSGALANYGISIEMQMNLNNDLKASLDGIYSVYKEDTDDPMDEDASSYLIHTALNYKNFRVGLGYYEMSDDSRVELNAIGNDAFDPLEEGVYGGEPDDNTVYFDLGYETESYQVEIMIGKTDVDATGDGSTEIDAYLSYSITEKILLEIMFVDVNDDNSDLDYQVYAGGISMNF